MTSDQYYSQSTMSETLTVITQPPENLIPQQSFGGNLNNSMFFNEQRACIIPIEINSINEEKLLIDWSSFLPTAQVAAYFIHYTCRNTGEIQSKKISQRCRQMVSINEMMRTTSIDPCQYSTFVFKLLNNLTASFIYDITVIAADKNQAILYTSPVKTVEMNAPPNAPIIAIR
jgi:hypothetical protein